MDWPSLPAWPRRWSWPSGHRLRALGFLAAGVLGLLVLTLAIYSSVELARFERVEERRATFVYAAAQPLIAGVNVKRADLAGTLARLKYSDSRGAPPAPGQFRRLAGGWEIHLRGGDSRPVRVDVQDDRILRVSRDGHDIGAAALEPEVLTSADDRPGEDHRPVRLADVPLVLINAVLAAEDHRFFEHGGLDVRGLVRAAWANLRARRVTQGGSTITQQLVKNRLVGPRRTFFRKAREAWLATLVELRYSKTQILESY
ncbi:MAG TPA: transglycosylase domain-containing protein, partial [Methylomirabilota bacterium]|nr:transglycosylase domain-containing protein [Methylomirabilota bacterium]